MSCEEGCLPSHLQHPPAQASRDSKWGVDPYCKEILSNTQTLVTTKASTKSSRQYMAWLTGSRVPCAVQMGKCFLQTGPPFWVVGLNTTNPKVIEHLRSGKATGDDEIPPELWKEGKPALHSKLHELLVCCWEQGKLPSDLRDAIIVTLYKNKGEMSDCSIGGSLCSPSQEKLFFVYSKTDWYPLSMKTIYQKPSVGSEQTEAPETWCLFSDSYQRNTVSMYVAFVDLTKVFDTVSKNGL